MAEVPKVSMNMNDESLDLSPAKPQKLKNRAACAKQPSGRPNKQSRDKDSKGSIIIRDESMESSHDNRQTLKARIAQAKRPRAGVDVEKKNKKMKTILDARISTTDMMMASILEICGPIAGNSLGPVQTSGGDGKTDREEKGARSNPRTDELSVEEKGNGSHHADLASSPSSNSNGAVTPHGTVPVKGGSKFEAILSVVRVRNPEPVVYTIKKYPRCRPSYEQSYEKHVLKGETNDNPKVTVGDTSVTAKQFVNSLKEGGKETNEFVDVCIMAMIKDWKEKRKSTSLIIDRPTVVKILDDNCTQEFIDDYLRKEANLELLERIYIFLNNRDHWVLCIMSLHHEDEKLFILCPTVNDLEKNNIHENVINNVVGKLQSSLVRLQLEYTEGKMTNKNKHKRTLLLNLKDDTKFPMKFSDESAVLIKSPGDPLGNHGGAFIYLLKLMEDHMGAEISKCEASHEALLQQKMRLTHLLVHHSWNILNPTLLE